MSTINQKNVVKCQIWKHTKWRTKFKQQIAKVVGNVFRFCEQKERKAKGRMNDVILDKLQVKLTINIPNDLQ